MLTITEHFLCGTGNKIYGTGKLNLELRVNVGMAHKGGKIFMAFSEKIHKR
jgi:hypothetical protein